MNLNPLTERIKYFNEKYPSPVEFRSKSLKTIEAGEQSLFLGQFIVCDKDGKPLEKPNQYDYYGKGETSAVDSIESYNKALEEYQQAEQRLLFKGWKVTYSAMSYTIIQHPKNTTELIFMKKSGKHKSGRTIESIAHLKPELTEQGKKELI